MNGPDLLTELPSLQKSLPNPSFTKWLPPFHWKPLFSLKSVSSHPLPKNSVCAPLCHNNTCCASRFCTGGGEPGGSRGEQIQEFARRAMKANARPGAHSEAPGWTSRGGASPAPRTGKPGQSAHDWSTQGVFPWKISSYSRFVEGFFKKMSCSVI